MPVVEHLEAARRCLIRSKRVGSAIGRTVVDHDELIILGKLVEYRTKTFVQIRDAVVSGNHDREQRPHSLLFS